MKNKFLSLVLLTAALLLWCPFIARAQVDSFGAYRTTVLQPLTVLSQSSTTPLTNSGPWVDIRGFQGTGEVLFFATNVSGSTPKLWAYLQGSNDQTNSWALTNFAVGTLTTKVLPNFALHDSTGTNSLTLTNTFFVPGTLTTPTSAAAGWANQYVVADMFSHTATICTNVAGGAFQLGFSCKEQPIYVRVVTVATGDTNVSIIGGAIVAKPEYW